MQLEYTIDIEKNHTRFSDDTQTRLNTLVKKNLEQTGFPVYFNPNIPPKHTYCGGTIHIYGLLPDHEDGWIGFPYEEDIPGEMMSVYLKTYLVQRCKTFNVSPSMVGLKVTHMVLDHCSFSEIPSAHKQSIRLFIDMVRLPENHS